MASKLGTVFVELSLDDKVYKQKLSETLTSAQTTVRGIETSWKALGSRSEAVFDAQRRAAQNAYTLIKNYALSTETDKIRAAEASASKIKSINEQQFGHQTSLIESMKKNWIALSAVALSAYYTLNKFYDLAERGAKVRAVEEGFASMARSFNITGDALIKKMEEVTKNTIDNSDLMAKALRLISEGFSESQIVAISEAARVSARLTGKTISEAYDQISDSLINLRERGLKTAGIVIDMDKAEREHAKTLGVAKEQLSDYGRRMAWVAGIMEKTKEDSDKLGKSLKELNDFEEFQKRKTVWKDFGDEVGKVANFFVSLATAVVKAQQAIQDFHKTNWESQIKRARGALEWLGIISPSPSQYALSERMTAGAGMARGGPSQIKPVIPVFDAESLKEGIEYAKLLYEGWKEEYYAYYDEIYTAQKKANEEREFWMNEEARWKKLQMAEETEAIREGIERARDLHQGWLEERFSQIEAEENEIREGIERARDLQQIWLEEYDAKTLETIQRELLMKADFYSQISGYEDKYREAQFAWIDEEAKRLKEAGMEAVAIAKWVAQKKMGFDSEVFSKENEDRQQAFSSMAQNFAQMAMLYKEDSTARSNLSALSKAATIAEIALQAQKNLMIAVGAVVQQGTGDPYTAFARIAAMIAVVSSVLQIVGIAFSSSGGGSRSYSAGGTAIVGGVAGEASESAKKSLELLEDTYTMEYRELSGIYDEMKSLNRNITGLVSSIIRGGGIGGAESYGIEVGLTQSWAQKVGKDSTTNFAIVGTVLGLIIPGIGWLIGTVIGYVVGWLWKGIFGGGKTITVGGTGIALGPASVGGLLGGEGMTAQQYADIKEKEDKGWFGGTSRKYYTLYQALDEDVNRLLTKVFVDLGATLVELSVALGTDMQAVLDYVFPGGKINLAGLDAEGIDKAISQFISGAADDAIDALFGQMLRSYQRVGEGLLQTAVRLVIDKEIVLDTLKMTGQAFVGTTSQIIAFSEAIIEMAGDLKTLREAAETYYDKFFNDAEKQVRLQGQLTDALTDMNMMLPYTREGYRHLVEGLNLTTEAGQRAYVSLLTLAEGADAYYSYLEEAAKAAEEAAKAAEEAAKKAKELILGTAQDALSIAEQNLRAAFDAEKKRITDAYQLELKGMNESLQRTQSIISELQASVDKLRSAKERMNLIDDASVRANYLSAQIQLMMVLQQARGGNLSGIGGLDKVLATVTGAGPSMYATAVDYKRDFYHTYSTIAELESLTGNQLSIEQQTLALQQKQIELLGTNYQAELVAMDEQLNALLGINISILSIPQAIANLIAAQLAVTGAGGAPPSPAVQTRLIDWLYSAMLGRSAEAGGAAFWKGQIAGGESINSIIADFIYSAEFQQRNATDMIGGIYEALLGREADVGGRAFYEAAFAAGTTLERIIAEILGSPEYGGIRAARGFASGGTHPGGWRLVGEAGPELEYTGPSNIVPFKKKSGSDLELINEVRQLRKDMQQANYAIAKNTDKTARILNRFDSDGLPAERVI